MYLTAHRVRSRSGQEGINAYLSLHRDQALPLRRAGEPDLDYVAQLAGGYPVAESRSLRPGGNMVTAYLDLAAPDTAPEGDLGHAVSEIRSRIGSERAPITAIGGGVAARFGAVVTTDGSRDQLRGLLDGLWAAAAALLVHRDDPPRTVTGAYVVWASCAADGVRLWLPPVTLLRRPRSSARQLRILVPEQVMHAGRPFDVLREAAVTLLGVDDADVQREGGIEIVDPRTATTLARYEPPAPT